MDICGLVFGQRCVNVSFLPAPATMGLGPAWANNNATLGQRLVFAGKADTHTSFYEKCALLAMIAIISGISGDPHMFILSLLLLSSVLFLLLFFKSLYYTQRFK